MQYHDASPLSLKFSKPTYLDISHLILSFFCYLHEACALILLFLEVVLELLHAAGPIIWTFLHSFFINFSFINPGSGLNLMLLVMRA